MGWTLKNFDFFPKTMEDYRVRTYAGAAVSVVSMIIIVVLFFSELSLYFTTSVEPHLFVDTSRGQKLRINVDVTFDRLPCAYLSLDTMDISGDAQLDVMQNIFKRRIDKDGIPINEVEEPKPPVVKAEQQRIPLNANNCASCYGAESAKHMCCETCEDVREAYRQKGWAFASPQNIAQCINEGFEEHLEKVRGEGCQIYGYVLVEKVAGNFHVAPGKSYQNHHTHIHDIQLFKQNTWDLSHRIHKLSFGEDFPGVINPLDGVTKVADPSESSMYQYYIKVVPTIYQQLDGTIIHTNQFSVTEYYKKLGHDVSHGLPGVFFIYDLSPIKVRFEEKQRTLAAFLTGICAIIGGVYTVSGILDSFIFVSMRSLKKKVQLGKAS